MKAVILGSGASIQHYKPEEHVGAWVIGANDAIKSHKLNAFCCADTYQDICLKRPIALTTPANVEFWGRKNVGWEGWAKHRGNCNLVHTRRFNDFWDSKELLRPDQHIHGYHTPFFCATVAIKKGFDELYFYGIDGDCFNVRNCYTVIKELNALHEATKGVWLCEHSALWDIQNDEKCHTTLKGSSTKVRIKLNVNRI